MKSQGAVGDGVATGDSVTSVGSYILIYDLQDGRIGGDQKVLISYWSLQLWPMVRVLPCLQIESSMIVQSVRTIRTVLDFARGTPAFLVRPPDRFRPGLAQSHPLNSRMCWQSPSGYGLGFLSNRAPPFELHLNARAIEPPLKQLIADPVDFGRLLRWHVG